MAADAFLLIRNLQDAPETNALPSNKPETSRKMENSQRSYHQLLKGMY